MERWESFRQAAEVLPRPFRDCALALSREEQERGEELRLRMGRPMALVEPTGERELDSPPVTRESLERLLEYASGSSLHTALPQLSRGFLTVPGGHRLGLCGRVVLREGEVVNLRPLSSASLRIARQIRGSADRVLPRLCQEGRLRSTLILAPPGLGKTTLLRDVIRKVSEGEDCVPLRVSLADERGEVAAMWDGQPRLDVGRRTDVIEGCPKGQALTMLLRAMSPQVLAVDEITARADGEALTMAVGCGATLLATAHGTDREDLIRRPLYRALLEENLFQRLVTIRRRGTERICDVEVL